MSSNNGPETNSYNSDEKNENYKQQNHEGYTHRQIQSSFHPSHNIHHQQTMLPPTQQQQLAEQFQALHVAQQQHQYYSGQGIPPLPLGVDMTMLQTHYTQIPPELQQQGVIYAGYPPANYPVPLTMMNPPQLSTGMRLDAQPFLPAAVIKKVTSNESTPVTDDPEKSDKEGGGDATTSSFIYDLKKYKHDYFISNLTCKFDRDFGKFGSPTGICALNDDRLLVANFGCDTVLLIDLNGEVHKIYKDLQTPKDVLYYSSSPSQAVIATQKAAVILDLETSKVVVRSKLRGFYPWNIQYMKERGTFAACDPSGERIVFLDKNLEEIGSWSLSDQNQQHLRHTQPNAYKKVYPYTAYFLPDDTSLVLTHHENLCKLEEYNTTSAAVIRTFNTPPTLHSYSIYVDSARQCLIADKVNHRLVSVDKDSNIEEYKCKSIQDPYSMTFLSTGTLCVTDQNKSHGTSGGVAIISENDLKTKQ